MNLSRNKLYLVADSGVLCFKESAIQEKKTLMSEFEYVAVLVSLVLGLGIANILSGLGRIIIRRHDYSIDLVHLVWSLALFLKSTVVVTKGG